MDMVNITSMVTLMATIYRYASAQSQSIARQSG
jgi:hypothetical protein